MTSLLVAIGVGTGGAEAPPPPNLYEGGLSLPTLQILHTYKYCTDKISLEEIAEEFVT